MEYLKINKESWNNRVEEHYKSDFYDIKNFKEGKTSLKEIELDLLGDVKGKSILHLQCHFGQDSIALSRMGAKVTAVDLSDVAIERAKQLAAECGEEVEFICSDIYELPQNLTAEFDVVFTSYGVIGWLPNLDKWANVISHFLKPNGKLIFVEFHPFLWMYDDELKYIKYNYFNKEVIKETETGTYANKEAKIELSYVWWNHSLSEVMTSLMKSNLEIKTFQEYDYSPYNIFKNTVEFEEGKHRLKHLEDKVPIVFSLSSIKSHNKL